MHLDTRKIIPGYRLRLRSKNRRCRPRNYMLYKITTERRSEHLKMSGDYRRFPDEISSVRGGKIFQRFEKHDVAKLNLFIHVYQRAIEIRKFPTDAEMWRRRLFVRKHACTHDSIRSFQDRKHYFSFVFKQFPD